MKMFRYIVTWFFCLMLVLPQVATAQESESESVTETLLPRAGESDVGYLTRLLQDGLSASGREVRIGGFSGALSSRATFEQMSIEDDEGVWLLVEGAALQWNRSALFQRRIEIAEISAERITILRAPVGEESEGGDLVSLPSFELPELPLSVRLDQLQVDEVVLGPALFGQELRASVSGSAALADGEGEARLQIDRIDDVAGQFRLEAAFSNVTRVLGLDLAIEEDAGGLAVTLLNIPNSPSAALTIAGEGPVEDFSADITLATDNQPRVEGQFQLQTTQPGVAQAVTLDLAGDLRPLLQEEFHPFFGENSRLSTRARRFDDGSLSLDDLDIRTEKLGLRGRMQLGVDGLPQLIDLRGEVLARDGSRVLLPVPGGQTSIDEAELRLAFDASENEDWELVLDLLGFDNGDFKVESLFINGLGRITADGFGEDIDVIDALIDFSALGLAATDPGLNEALGPSVSGSLALIWREDMPLLLPGFQLEGRDYAVNGRARLDDGVIFANTTAEFRDVSRLSTLAGRPLSGGVQAQVDATLGPERDRFLVAAEISGLNLTLDQPELDLLLAGRSQITLDAHGADGQITLRQLEATARTLRADLRGQLSDDDIELRGEIDFTDLSVLGESYGGALDAQLSLRGPREREALTIEAVARDLTIGQPDADRLLRGETRLTVDGRRDGAAFDLGNLRVSNSAITLEADGRYEAGASRLEVSSTLPNLGAIRPGFGGRIVAEASLREDGSERRVGLEATATNLRLGAAAADGLLTGTHRLNASLVQRPDEVLLESLTLNGPQVNATIAGRIADGRPALELDARLNNLAAVVPGIVGPATLAGTARDTGNGYALDLGVTGPAGLNAQIAGEISNELQANLRAQGGTDLALLNPRLEPRSIQGPAEFDVTLNGPLALTSLNGSAQANNLTLVLPQQNIRLTDIAAQAQISAGRTSVTLSGRSANGGQVALDGDINLAAPITGDLRARLSDFRVVNPQLFETDVSGTVAITGALTQGPLISGNLQLDRTELRIPRVGLAGRGYIPPDIRHVGESAAARQTRDRAGIFQGETHGRERRPASLDLTIDAPSRIFLRGRGLDAELGGTLRLTGTTADVIPIGQFGLIRGRLDLLGNRFTLNEGFASLQGDFVPFIRLIASTERDGVIAQIVLEGRADSPEIRFESTPPLPEEEVVSLLLFGRGFETLSLFQAAQLASSLATLSGRSEGIMERLRRNIGLDDLDVRTDEDGETSVRLGRYLTENIYTDVEVSPQGSSEVSINIDLSPSLTARGRVDNEGRVGVGLFFERDY
ncbi:translocation/assembly module TamB domain-containing protein [Roseinatronobacter sp.]|uniref:translocation/assembly module TamB domain-containing protein n=1 Tax=Roseinatronobacter sp. TaxID=1945755 RepID=UPI0025E4F5B2|nr:translocation/assembly module TamB domain-containing protein [Rhodobaca sp.]